MNLIQSRSVNLWRVEDKVFFYNKLVTILKQIILLALIVSTRHGTTRRGARAPGSAS